MVFSILGEGYSSWHSSSVDACQGSFASALAESAGNQALLRAFEGNIDDGNQTLRGAEGADEPVWVSLSQDLQDIALVKAEMTGLGGYVMAQRSHFTGKQQRTQKKRR